MKQLAYAVAVVLCGALPASAEELATAEQPAPMFRLPLYNPVRDSPPMIGLDRFVGPDAVEKDVKVVLLSFMASFCGPCKKEMPYLQRLQEKYGARGLRVVMVSIDTEAEGQKQIDELIAVNKITFPVLKDRFNLVARRWLGNQSPMPSVFLIRPDGVVSLVHRGYNEEVSAQLAREVEKAISGGTGASLPATAGTTPP